MLPMAFVSFAKLKHFDWAKWNVYFKNISLIKINAHWTSFTFSIVILSAEPFLFDVSNFLNLHFFFFFCRNCFRSVQCCHNTKFNAHKKSHGNKRTVIVEVKNFLNDDDAVCSKCRAFKSHNVFICSFILFTVGEKTKCRNENENEKKRLKWNKWLIWIEKHWVAIIIKDSFRKPSSTSFAFNHLLLVLWNQNTHFFCCPECVYHVNV